jgi:hypothetical protein
MTGLTGVEEAGDETTGPALIATVTGWRRIRVRRPSMASWVAFGLAVSGLLSGCATYNEKMEVVRVDVNRGAYPEAITRLNEMLDVDTAQDLPNELDGNLSLMTLERSVLLQAESEFRWSARDLNSAEEDLELLDLGTDAVGKIGKYVYSGSSDTYAASPTERLAMNALNMANYLALGSLDEAAVEARRYTDTRDYLSSIGLDEMVTVGAYLAGFAFEHLGQGDRALRYYEEALEGHRVPSLDTPIARLAATYPYRGPHISALLAQPGTAASADASRPAEILTVVALGRVPRKVPERMPIGAAVGFAGTFITGNTAILERSVFKVVVYPELVDSRSLATDANITIDGKSARPELVSNLGKDIHREYEQIKPRIIGAALTRMITRAAAAEGARAAGNQAGGAVGLLAALLAEGSLVALDRPDTRSWSFLPDRVSIARTAVQPGTHEVVVRVGGVGETRTVTLDVPDGGFGVVVVTVPR